MFSKGVVTGTNPTRRERQWKRSLSGSASCSFHFREAGLAWGCSFAGEVGLFLRFPWKAWESLPRSGVLGLSLMTGGVWGAGLGALDVGGKFPAGATQAQPADFEEGECGS